MTFDTTFTSPGHLVFLWQEVTVFTLRDVVKPNQVGSGPMALTLKVGFSELAAGVGDGPEASSFANMRHY